MYSGLLNRIEDRKLQLQMYRSQQARAEWAKKQQQANQNLMAGLGRAAQQAPSEEMGSSATQAIPSVSSQQGMNWLNPQEMSTPQVNPQATTPVMTQGDSAEPTIDLSVLNGGNAL